MLDLLFKVELEIKKTIENHHNQHNSHLFRHESGRRLLLSEVKKIGVQDGPIIGALVIFYAPSYFMTIDRIISKTGRFKKKRRIIYHLNSRAGQIGSTLLLELLKISDGQIFSKPEFVQFIDKNYFRQLHISSGEINEALSRMFRKTMKDYFKVEGKMLNRKPFSIYFQEVTIKNPISEKEKLTYDRTKIEIDNKVSSYINELNRVIRAI